MHSPHCNASSTGLLSVTFRLIPTFRPPFSQDPKAKTQQRMVDEMRTVTRESSKRKNKEYREQIKVGGIQGEAAGKLGRSWGDAGWKITGKAVTVEHESSKRKKKEYREQIKVG